MSRRLLIADPSPPVSSSLKRFLEGAGFVAEVVTTVEAAVAAAASGEVDVVFAAAAASFDGMAVCRQVKEIRRLCPVVLIFAPDEESADEISAEAGADGYLVGPLKRGTVVSCAKAMLRIRDLQETVERLEGDLKRHVAEPPKNVEELQGSSADFEFFKKFLLMEVKRSRRYRYPVSFLLVAVDHFGERMGGKSHAERTTVLAEVLTLITRGLRDIDLSVPFSDERFLLFLPHTPRDGALVVATRIRERLTGMTALQSVTASVGVAAYEPTGQSKVQVSFGSMMKDASDALRRAQLAGGDRVEASEKARRDRISMG